MSDPDFVQRYGPWAVIAGASHGVGAAFAHQLAACGLNCVLVARRAEPLAELKAQLEREYAVEVLAVVQDLARHDACEHLVAAVGTRHVGLFVYNAGGDPYITRFIATPADDWERLLCLNSLTVMRCSHAFGGAMLERGRGGLLLVGSQAALGGVRKLAMYSASKGFALNLGESLWAEWKDQGVDVLNVLIGTVDTPTMREAMVKLNIPDALDMVLPQAEELALWALQNLAEGPTLIHPQDTLCDSPGQARREHVLATSAQAAVFIGKD
ncbi:SDR family NAD(P)-dependent oxidoreductase [Pseudomonas sp. 32A]|uniref:SDR family NAD(P)-dependent oxidoreductase n=1 Tax=Pseudomonas sp. 32A TaxID=651185 RepID=UPI0040452A50